MKWIFAGLITIFESVEVLRYLTVAQKNNYNLLMDKKTVCFYLISKGIVLPAVLFEIISFKSDWFLTLKIIFLCLIVFIEYLMAIAVKTRLKFTKRARTNYLLSVVFMLIINILSAILFNEKIAAYVIFAINIFTPFFIYFFTQITNIKFEKKNLIFVENELKKISDSSIIKIGITGSFGKTSCKNILLHMLSKKYKTIATESNYNTPMGLALTAKKVTDEEVFIAEMGARKKGDIKYLCEVFSPDIGIITGVCEQHLQTFGSLHEIFMEKSELSKATEYCVFNGNDKYALKMYRERKGKKGKIGVDKIGDIYADHIKMDRTGSKFVIHIGNAQYDTQTSLLGRHNIQNILLCVAVAKYLKVTDEDILNAIKELKCIKHRLEYNYINGIHIIDDGYNSNEVGVKFALEALDEFIGRKVIVSQGLVECGRKTKTMNYSVGKNLCGHADVIIVCGSNRRYIKKGAEENGFKGKIFSYKSLLNAQKHFNSILMKGDVLLLQNDIPDLY